MDIIYSIYKATNKTNGKVYIGYDSNWPSRKITHKSNLRLNKFGYKFYNALRKYGWDNFEWEVIYQSKDQPHTLNEMENHFIIEYDSYRNGYNMTLGGEGSVGHKYTPTMESRIKASNSLRGRIFTDEHKKNMSLAFTGLEKSQAHKDKIAEVFASEWIVEKPDGELMTIINLKKFCRNNNLDQGAMWRVANGKQKQHKGYKCQKK